MPTGSSPSAAGSLGTAPGMAALPLALGTLRCRQWLHFLALPAAGASPRSLAEAPAALVVAVLAAAGALAWGYGLNAIADRSADAPEKNPLAGRERVPLPAAAAPLAAGAVALAGGAWLGALPLAAAGLSMVASLAYSLGPRLKSAPLLGLAANTVGFAALLGLAPPAAARHPAAAALAVAFVGFLLQNQLAHELADAEEDEAEGALTTARWLGPRRTRLAVAGAGAAAALAVVWLGRVDVPHLACAAGLVLGAAVATGGPPARARRRHRLLAAASGAALWLGAGG